MYVYDSLLVNISEKGDSTDGNSDTYKEGGKINAVFIGFTLIRYSVH